MVVHYPQSKRSDLILSSGLCKEVHKKVPSVVALPGTRVELISSNFKGDTTNDAFTCGVLILKADTIIRSCSFAHHKSGAIMMDLEPWNKVLVQDNNIVSSETCGVYIQGRAAKPIIKGQFIIFNHFRNKIRFCRCSGIKTYLDVDAFVNTTLILIDLQ